MLRGLWTTVGAHLARAGCKRPELRLARTQLVRARFRVVVALVGAELFNGRGRHVHLDNVNGPAAFGRGPF